jgi:autotransporter-associated beta strand protein
MRVLQVSAVVLGLVALWAGEIASAATISLSPVNRILRSGDPDGVDRQGVTCYNGGPANNQHSLFQFDLGSMPLPDYIASATLTVTHDSAIWPQGQAAGQESQIYAVTTPWVPTEVSWNSAAAGVPWTTPGGDYAGLYASNNAVIPDNAGVVPMSYNVTSLIKEWKAGTLSNNGMLFLGTPGNGLHFYGMDAVDPSYRPVLTITSPVYAQYHLGEAGSLSGGGNIPLDVTGSHSFLNANGPVGGNVSTDHAPVAGSTASLALTGGFYSTDNPATLPADNFSVDVWAKTSTVDQNTAFVYASNGGEVGSLILANFNGNWGATYNGLDWIGAAAGEGQPIIADTWQHLQVVRSDGVSTFYIDGVAQAHQATAGFSGWTGPHLACNPGGWPTFVGNIDELTISSVAVPVSWTGGGDATWSTATGGNNWKGSNSGMAADYGDGAHVTFDDTATVTTVDISAADVLPASVTFDNSTKDYTVTGTKGIAGTTGLVKKGTGTLVLANPNTYTGLTTVMAGTLELAESAQTPAMLSNVADIQGGKLVFDYSTTSPASTIAAVMDAGYDLGWASGQITNSTAGVTGLTLGWRDDSVSQVTIMATYAGDANLTGTVDVADLTALLNNYNKTDMVWANGDFNYDGSVNVADLTALLNKYNRSVGGIVAAGAMGSTAVPEPSSIALLTIGLLGLLAYAWRKRK